MDEELLQQAKAFEAAASWPQAAAIYQNLLENDKKSLSILTSLSWCLSRAEEYDKAIITLQTLCDLEPRLAKWPYMVGYQYYCKFDWVNAVIWFDRSLILYPDYFIVKYRIAYALIQMAGIYQKLTKAEYWKALGHLKDCHRIWMEYSDEKKRREKHTYFDINFLHGKCLMDLPNYRNEAIARFMTAIELEPDNVYAKYNLSKTFYLQNDYISAKSQLPNSKEYYVLELAAHIEGKLGNYDDAIIITKNLLEKKKKDYLYAFLAEINRLKGNLPEAYTDIQFAIRLKPDNHKSYFILGKIFLDAGLFRSAETALTNAIKIKNDVFDSQYIECQELLNKISLSLTSDYVEDEKILKDLKKEILSSLEVSSGKIQTYNKDRGFGFIKCKGRTLFFHISSCKYIGVSIDVNSA